MHSTKLNVCRENRGGSRIPHGRGVQTLRRQLWTIGVEDRGEGKDLDPPMEK